MKQPAVCGHRPARLLVAAVLCSLAGCALGPNYERPPVAAPESTREQVGPTEAASLADLPWWEVFRDPTLQALVENAIGGNYDLRAATARVEAARNLVIVARSDIFPQVGYQGAATRERLFIPQGSRNTTINAFLGSFNLAWEIDIWGRIRRATESARADYLATEYVQRAVLLTLVSDVAQAYFELLELDRELEITQTTIKTFGDTLDLFDRRYQGGVGTLLEVSRARAALAEARAAMPEIERQIVAKENQLSLLLGHNPGAIARGAPFDRQRAMPEIPVGLPSQLLERRPDILRAEQAVVAANADIGVALASFFPRFGLTSLYGGQSSELEHLAKGGANVWAIGTSLTGPLFQGGRLLANYAATKAQWEASVAAYEQTALRAFGEVSNALVAREKLALVRSEREQGVDALRTSVDLSLRRYSDGIASYIEVLEAQQQLFPSQLSLARTQRDELIAVVDLYRALGGGWYLAPADWQMPADEAGDGGTASEADARAGRND